MAQILKTACERKTRRKKNEIVCPRLFKKDMREGILQPKLLKTSRREGVKMFMKVVEFTGD